MFPQSISVFIRKAEVMSDRSYSSVKTLLQESFSKIQQSMCLCTWLWRSMPLHFHVCKGKCSTGSASTPVSWAPLHIDLNGMWRKVNPALPNGPPRTTARAAAAVSTTTTDTQSVTHLQRPGYLPHSAGDSRDSAGQEVVIVNVLALIYFWVLVDLLKCVDGSVYG